MANLLSNELPFARQLRMLPISVSVLIFSLATARSEIISGSYSSIILNPAETANLFGPNIVSGSGTDIGGLFSSVGGDLSNDSVVISYYYDTTQPVFTLGQTFGTSFESYSGRYNSGAIALSITIDGVTVSVDNPYNMSVSAGAYSPTDYIPAG